MPKGDPRTESGGAWPAEWALGMALSALVGLLICFIANPAKVEKRSAVIAGPAEKAGGGAARHAAASEVRGDVSAYAGETDSARILPHGLKIEWVRAWPLGGRARRGGAAPRGAWRRAGAARRAGMPAAGAPRRRAALSARIRALAASAPRPPLAAQSAAGRAQARMCAAGGVPRLLGHGIGRAPSEQGVGTDAAGCARAIKCRGWQKKRRE